MNFDLENVRPFLTRLEENALPGLQVDMLVRFAAETSVEDERSMHIAVVFQGTRAPLEFGVFMDDVDAPDLYFHSPSKPLIAAIDRELVAFAEELGI